MSRKALTVLLAVVALAAAVPVAEAAQSPFVDVPEGHWAYEAIANLAAAGLVQGYPDGTFGGSRTLTRYEAAMIFSRMLTRLENVVRQDVAGEVQGLSAQVAGDVTQRVMARATAEIQQAIVAAREALAQDVGRMVEEKLAQAPPRTVERVIVEKQPQVTERVVVEQPVGITDEVRAAIAAIVADQVKRELAPEKLGPLAAEMVKAKEFEEALDAKLSERIGPVLGLQGLDVDVAALRGDVDAIREVLSRRVSELSAAIEELRLRVGALEESSGVAASTQEGLAQSVAAVNDLVVRADQRITGLEDKVAGLEVVSAQKAAQGDVEALNKRVQSLEQSNRRLTWALVLVGLAAVAAVFMPAP
ncbi:MAG: S-layer homology domain-containing protein [Bacillota bacterium]